MVVETGVLLASLQRYNSVHIYQLQALPAPLTCSMLFLLPVPTVG